MNEQIQIQQLEAKIKSLQHQINELKTKVNSIEYAVGKDEDDLPQSFDGGEFYKD